MTTNSSNICVAGPMPTSETRIRRLRAALADFDTATIATIHQFCHLVLRGLGVAGDSDPHATLVEDLTELRRDVVDDLFLARAARGGNAPDYAASSSDARMALDQARAPLLPAGRVATGRGAAGLHA